MNTHTWYCLLITCCELIINCWWVQTRTVRSSLSVNQNQSDAQESEPRTSLLHSEGMANSYFTQETYLSWICSRPWHNFAMWMSELDKEKKISRPKHSLSVSLIRHSQLSRTLDYRQNRKQINSTSKGKSMRQSSRGTFDTEHNNPVNPLTIYLLPYVSLRRPAALLWWMHK